MSHCISLKQTGSWVLIPNSISSYLMLSHLTFWTINCQVTICIIWTNTNISGLPLCCLPCERVDHILSHLPPSSQNAYPPLQQHTWCVLLLAKRRGMYLLGAIILKTMAMPERYIKDSKRDSGSKIWMKMELRMWRNLR